MRRVIQTEGSRRIDGPVPCKEGEDTHTWLVDGEFDNPRPGQMCRCGKEQYPDNKDTSV